MEFCYFRKPFLGASEGDTIELFLSFILVFFVVLLREVSLKPFFLKELGVLAHSAEKDDDLENNDKWSTVFA